MSTIVCIGSGNMGSALMKAASNVIGGSCVFLTDIDHEKARTLAASLKVNVIESNIEAVEKGDYVFLAVKPQVLPQVLAEIAAAVKEKLNSGFLPVFVSMAAGWSIAKIKAAISVKLPVVRIMPNTPALIGKGMIALAASP
ncbi:MAG: NAD(P)-binding domain-containing protein, partial [Treponema sp.]|nr:NAD(P)-binding domain-containing protein [Treponema sp.]